MRALRGSAAGLAILLTALIYYAAFIWKTSFTIASTRYFTLLDDAMVSMQYARHLVRGQGLVWNPGEPPVEGFSNPLWTLIMAVAHLLPLPRERFTLAIQVFGAGLLVAVLGVVRGLAMRLIEREDEIRVRPPRHRPSDHASPAPLRSLPLVAVVLVAFYFPLTYWTLEGMEVGLLALIATAAGAMLLARRSLPGLYGLLGAGILVRMDFVVVLLALAVCGMVLDPARRTRHLVLGLGTALGVLALLTFARLLYFHDPLPNTYYLKLTGYPTGLRVTRGAWVLLQSIARSSGLLVLIPLVAAWLARGDARRRLLVLLAPFVAQCAYSVWVGGDAWEEEIPCNRYLTVAMPLLLVAAAWSITTLAARLDPRSRLGALPPAGITLAVGLAIAPFSATLFLKPLPYARTNAELVTRALAVRDLALPGGSVAATGIGTIGYYSDRRIVDLLGKCDRHIARLPMRRAIRQNPLTYFFPGHLKWDYGYSIGVLKPDIVAQPWEYPDEAIAYLRDYDLMEAPLNGARDTLFARRGSARVRWPR